MNTIDVPNSNVMFCETRVGIDLSVCVHVCVSVPMFAFVFLKNTATLAKMGSPSVTPCVGMGWRIRKS